MRADANKIALRAIRNLLGGAKPFELDVSATRVACSMTALAAEQWPGDGGGLIETEDGPWPAGVAVDCAWPGGKCRLLVEAFRWTSTKYLDDLCIRVRTDQNREVIFVNVSNELDDAVDGAPDRLGVRFYITKPGLDYELVESLNDGMRDTLAESKLPILGKNKAELCQVEVPSGNLLPSADHAMRTLVSLALLKVDFIDSRRTAQRGKPLVDLRRWLSAEQVAAVNRTDFSEAGDDEAEPRAERSYWAGGITKQERLVAFKAGKFWQIGWKRTSDKPAAKKTWKQFAGIQVGDYFAIKSLGGTHDLAVHLIGEVTAIDAMDGKLQLEPLSLPLYKGKGPTGRGAGNWHDTIVPITRPDIIAMIFEGAAPVAEPAATRLEEQAQDLGDLPLNLILYGPPGTGKTHHLTEELIEKFQRVPSRTDSLEEIAAERTWFEVIAIALTALGKTKVPALERHPLIRAKHAVNPVKHLSARLWATLQMHTIESSKTVHYTKRAPEQYFDKTDDSEWFLAEELPDELKVVAEQLDAPPPMAALDDFTFVTFHQAYSYEDFIEGIRPSTDQDGDLSYSLEPGAFMRAAQKALRLAGFEGTLHDFCGLTPAQRTAQFRGARRYAVFIDEINRGNVSRIFGELITLLEDDKRLGEEHEVIVHLPYSKQRFGVPPNLHVIGTMNTADRSIDALDTALRRRFDFRELAPKPELLDFDIEGNIEPDLMLREINRRLEKLYDRDHCIGHAYLYALKKTPTLDGLKRVFRNKVIPLLQEYFYGDWGKIGLVLGKDFVRRREAPGKPFAAFDHDDHDALAERTCWELNDIDKLSNVAFQRIYKHVPDA